MNDEPEDLEETSEPEKTYPTVKWKDLTPARLRALARDYVGDAAHDMEIDRDNLIEEQGHDVVGEMMALERFLLREATRRENPQPVKYTGRRARTKLTLAK